jgi:hypothetical protein
MPNTTTPEDARRLADMISNTLTQMEKWGADFTHQYLTGTRLELQHKDGGKLVIAVTIPSK